MKNRYLVIDGAADDCSQAITMCGEALHREGIVGEDFAKLCVEREKKYPTGLPTEIPTAIPHVKSEGILENSICFLKLAKPVTFRRMDDEEETVDTDMIFNLAIKDPNEHLQVLQNMMEFLNDREALEKCRDLSKDEIVAFLEEKLG